MTVLDSVLIEEYNRKENIKLCCRDSLAKLPPEQQEKRKQLEASIQEIEFDQKKILAALEVAGIDIKDYLEPRRLFNLKE